MNITKLDIEIETQRFTLKILKPNDASIKYLNWFEDKSIKKFIVAANKKQTISTLKKFITEKFNSSESLLFGIFTKEDNTHIGNLKFGPIDVKSSLAIMGILIGEPSFRGKKVASEVILAGRSYLREKFKITTIELGVEVENIPAIRAYEKMGFLIAKNSRHIKQTDNVHVMRLS